MNHASAVSWQSIASELTRRAKKAERPSQHQRGRRLISQETVRAIRADHAAGLTRMAIARRYDVTPHYVYQITECGLRDDEREKSR